MLGSHEEAEDAVQQTFASAYSALRSRERDIRLKPWLYTIARNRCLSMLRARREQPAELDDQPTAGLSEQVEQRADLRDLLVDLRDLPPEQREALVLFELGDLSQAEVADVIGVEPVKVKALVFQARSTLIENRQARATPCAEIREQLATATGGALRRGPLRRHLKSCAGCSDYRDQVRSQRSALALILPVVPTAGLREGVLAAIGFGGGGGGAGLASGGAVGAATGSAVGGGGGGGGLFASLAGTGGAKLAVAGAVAAGTIGGGGVAIDRTIANHGVPSADAAEAPAGASAGSSGATSPIGGGPDPGAVVAVPVDDSTGHGDPGDKGDRRRDQRGGRHGEGSEDDNRSGDRSEGSKGDDGKRDDDDGSGESGGRGGKKGDGEHGNDGKGSKEGKGGKDDGPKQPESDDSGDADAQADVQPPPTGRGEGRRGGGKSGRESDADGSGDDEKDRRVLSLDVPH
jgi:RNA polymerase sigma factor (sigma-70 family)